jgi:conjugal transfer pilus assembly protein TraB
MAESSKRASMLRNKQMVMVAAVGAGVLLVSLAAAYFTNSATKPSVLSVEKPATKSLALGASSTDKEAWRTQSQSDLDKMAKRLQELEAAVSDSKKPDNKVAPPPMPPMASNTPPVSPLPITPPLPPGPPAPPPGLFTPASPPLVPPPPPPVVRPPVMPSTAPGAPLLKPGGVQHLPGSQSNEPPAPRIRSISLEEPASESNSDSKRSAGKSISNQSRGDKDTIGQSSETYMPAGTFARAVLLNGLDAPTGGQAQQNPMPIVLRLIDNAQLPNAVRANLKDCVVTANGTGDLSSERAYVRLDRLSCVDEEGGAIDVAVKGYVSGEDGKTGLRGRLVTKSGQVVANALFTGVIAGLGEALRQSSTTVATAPVTGVQTQTVNNSLRYGMGAGLARSTDRIAQYYIKLADKLFPVVEVDGGRVVDVVFTRGVSVERQ